VNQLTVKASKVQLILIIILGVFFVSIGLGMIVTSILGGFKLVPLVIGMLMLACFAAVVMLYLRGQRLSVTSFNDQGLTRNDGRKFVWENLGRVVDKMRIEPGTSKKSLWRTEIQFKDGSTAWLIPSKVVNFEEVNAFVTGLPCERVMEDA